MPILKKAILSRKERFDRAPPHIQKDVNKVLEICEERQISENKIGDIKIVLKRLLGNLKRERNAEWTKKAVYKD